MLIDDLGNDGEAEADAGGPGGEEGIKDGLEVLGIDAAAAIDDGNPGRAGGRL